MRLTDEELEKLLVICEAIKVECNCDWPSCKSCRAIATFNQTFSSGNPQSPRSYAAIYDKYRAVEQPSHTIIAELIREVIEARK